MSWFQQLGHPVTNDRYSATLEMLTDEDYDPEETAMVLQVVCREIEHDNPERAYAYMRSHLGKRHETLVIRALASLCDTQLTPNEQAVEDVIEDETVSPFTPKGSALMDIATNYDHADYVDYSPLKDSKQ